MSRKQVLSRLAVTLLGVAVFAAAAASIESEPAANGESDGGLYAPIMEGTAVAALPNLLTELVILFMLLGAVGAVWVLVTNGSEIARTVAEGITVLLVFVAVVAVLHMSGIATLFDGPLDQESLDEEGPDEGLDFVNDSAGSGEDTDETDSDDDSLFSFGRTVAVMLWLFAMLAGVILINAKRTTPNVADEQSDPDHAENKPSRPDVDTRLGEIATDTGGRIDAADDLNNEVYEAWVRMTAQLDGPDPETSTPGEFAAAATEAGLNPRDVQELTALFEEVRYGDREVTESRAKRAQELFERIGQEYGPKEDGTGGDS